MYQPDDRDYCAHCFRVLERDDPMVLVDTQKGGPDLYHMECFFISMDKIAEVYGFSKVKRPTRFLPWTHHLCTKCFRMMDASKGNAVVHKDEKGRVVSCWHMVCPPLSEKYVPPKF